MLVADSPSASETIPQPWAAGAPGDAGPAGRVCGNCGGPLVWKVRRQSVGCSRRCAALLREARKRLAKRWGHCRLCNALLLRRQKVVCNVAHRDELARLRAPPLRRCAMPDCSRFTRPKSKYCGRACIRRSKLPDWGLGVRRAVARLRERQHA